jgi:hypothetical protein
LISARRTPAFIGTRRRRLGRRVARTLAAVALVVAASVVPQQRVRAQGGGGFTLLATERAPGTSGVVTLVSARSPFAVAVTTEGRLACDLVVEVRGLADPAVYDGATAYVAWVATSGLEQIDRIGAYVVDVRFPAGGTHEIANRVRAPDHFNGEFFDESHVLGMVDVAAGAATPDYAGSFSRLRENADVIAELAPFRRHLGRLPDHELTLTLQTTHLPLPIFQFFSIDTAYFRPVEWSDAMSDMNWVTTGREVRWILRDKATAKENMDVHWRFKQGDVVKIRVTNDAKSLQPMSHPIHLHGQRFLVAAKDGVPNHNLVWKDTILVPVGATFDLLVEMSNPGTWMTHCHIAEHLQTGMMSLFTVEPAR